MHNENEIRCLTTPAMNMPPSGLKKRNFKPDASGYDFPTAQPRAQLQDFEATPVSRRPLFRGDEACVNGRREESLVIVLSR